MHPHRRQCMTDTFLLPVLQDAPKGALSAFMWFSNEKRAQVRHRLGASPMLGLWLSSAARQSSMGMPLVWPRFGVQQLRLGERGQAPVLAESLTMAEKHSPDLARQL